MCLAIIRPAVAARGDRYRSLADRKLAIFDRYCDLRVVLSSTNIEAAFAQAHRILTGIGSIGFRFRICLQGYRDARWKLSRRKAVYTLPGPIVYFRSAGSCNRDVNFIRCRNLKLAVYLLDLVVVGVGAFLQRVVERVVDSSLIRDRLEVAVRCSIVAYEAFLLSG